MSSIPLDALDLQRARLERADAAGDEDGLGDRGACSLAGLDVEAAVVALCARRSPPGRGGRWRLKGAICLSRLLGQLAAGAHRHRGNRRRSACRDTARCTGRRRSASESMMWALISSSPSSNTWNRPTGPAPTITASVSIAPLGRARAVCTGGRQLFDPWWCRARRSTGSSGSTATACPCWSFHSSASASAGLRLVMLGQLLAPARR